MTVLTIDGALMSSNLRSVIHWGKERIRSLLKWTCIVGLPPLLLLKSVINHHEQSVAFDSPLNPCFCNDGRERSSALSTSFPTICDILIFPQLPAYRMISPHQ
ncbi:hypothetical protein FOIG_05219 [Fusarium odoratissimum NRRL 54006]|uniref:Uncharacterized protein n=1 Tax=Fusarium odoratissimum (strain NRRL 54006) TaxID=1089451 RepID=X0K913_FUSO5|nr:uncharacterized protein FOIG_05219 [Fusarium odoratissimum NRRL 54006]EXM05222.1 hypothetical protein FOIG_05219 [Fusarium odoratissimum NRRL 54006]